MISEKDENMKTYKVKRIINTILFAIFIAEISALTTHLFSGNLKTGKN